MPPKISAIVLAIAILALSAGTAWADVYEESSQEAAPKAPPSFVAERPIEQQAPFLRTFGARYDSTAGTLTVSIGVFDPEYWAPIIDAGASLSIASTGGNFASPVLASGEPLLELSDFALADTCEDASLQEEATVHVRFGARESELTEKGIRGTLTASTTYANGLYSMTITNGALARLDLQCLALLGRPIETLRLGDLTPHPKPPPVTAHKATGGQLRSLETLFQWYRHRGRYGKALGNLDRLRNARVASDGWAAAKLVASHPIPDEQTGNQMVFRSVGGRWHVETWGTAPAVSHIPRPARAALHL
jgi:hypothetical protein